MNTTHSPVATDPNASRHLTRLVSEFEAEEERLQALLATQKHYWASLNISATR